MGAKLIKYTEGGTHNKTAAMFQNGVIVISGNNAGYNLRRSLYTADQIESVEKASFPGAFPPSSRYLRLFPSISNYGSRYRQTDPPLYRAKRGMISLPYFGHVFYIKKFEWNFLKYDSWRRFRYTTRLSKHTTNEGEPNETSANLPTSFLGTLRQQTKPKRNEWLTFCFNSESIIISKSYSIEIKFICTNLLSRKPKLRNRTIWVAKNLQKETTKKAIRYLRIFRAN